MVSEFMCASQGRLHYFDQQTQEKVFATEIIKYGSGKSDDGWWGAEKMAEHVQKAIQIFEISFPGDIAVFAFDNSSGHACKAKDALVANRMNLGPGGSQPIMHDCHAPLPIVTIGTKELTFESHSTQDLEALADVNLLWNARCSSERESSGCLGNGSLNPRHATPEHPQPQPRPPAQECLRNPEPGLDLQPLTRSQANRLEEPPLSKAPLALGKKDPGGQPWVASPEESARRRPTRGEAGGALGETCGALGNAAGALGKVDG